MEFFKLIRKEGKEFSRSMYITTAATGILNIGTAMILIMASQEIEPGQIDFKHILMFLACVIGFYFCKRHSFLAMNKGVEKELDRMRLRMSLKIRQANLQTFESIGKSVFNTVLNRDTSIIAQSSPYIINACGGIVMLVVGSVLIFFQSAVAFFVAAAIIFACVFYYLEQRKALSKHLEISTQHETAFFGNLTDLLDGFKQMKLNSAKDQAFYEESLSKLSGSIVESKIDSARIQVKLVVVGQLFMFLLMGGVVFVLPSVSPSELNTIPTVIALLLFISSPIGDIVGAFQMLEPTNHAVKNIMELEKRLDELNHAEAEEKPLEPFNISNPKLEFIGCEACEFSYSKSMQADGFSIGPIDFKITPGETVYVVGGNGSGKSTFLKMLTGLYMPDRGNLVMNGKPVLGKKVVSYRNLFTPIFTDFHLFDKLYGLKDYDQAVVDEWLDVMDLSDELTIRDGVISTRDLSTGQRKRLAMIVSVLEDRPVCVYDEVAADQDPHFRKYYYEEFLPKLKEQNKAVFAITHDDHYFHTADRVLRMEYGQLKAFE